MPNHRRLTQQIFHMRVGIRAKAEVEAEKKDIVLETIRLALLKNMKKLDLLLMSCSKKSLHLLRWLEELQKLLVTNLTQV